MNINFHKVSTLPGTLEADSFYYVANSTYAESYLTDSAGVAKAIGNSVMIDALIDQKISNLNALEIVADIPARDALTLSTNAMVLVTDASADATVTAGAALYVWNQGTTSFSKVSEYESLDVVLDWANIQNGPTSIVADIDDAVTKKHEHTNKSQLDKISEDGNGDILYDGTSIASNWITLDW